MYCSDLCNILKSYLLNFQIRVPASGRLGSIIHDVNCFQASSDIKLLARVLNVTIFLLHIYIEITKTNNLTDKEIIMNHFSIISYKSAVILDKKY
jgi:hypothetical protein